MKMFRKCLEKFGIVSKSLTSTEDLKEFHIIMQKAKTLKKSSESLEAGTNAWECLKSMDGVKKDQGKLSYTLLPFKAITEVAKVLEFGRLKYAKDNWQKVPNAKERYMDAAFRHLIAYYEGEPTDPESGLHHLAHATCCLLFVIWFDLVGIKEGDL